MKQLIFYIFWFAAAVAGCNNEDKAAAVPDFIFKDYQVSATEESETVTIRLQYRRSGKNGPAFVWPSPAKVALDTIELKADSVGKIGAFYEAQQPAAAFAGEHQILLKDEKGQQHRQPFLFNPFTISQIPETVNRENFVLEISGLKDNTPLHLVLTDTSFASNDINEIDTVRQGKLTVPKEKWAALVNGPVNLQLIADKRETIRENGKRTGQLTVSYSLQREFLLKD